MSTLRGLSLFSGIGGLDLAFEWAGGVVSAFCEIQPYCQKVLRKHWPDVPLFEDIRELRGTDVGAVDVIYGGFPCQPFSVAGNKKGKDDSRYLWPEFSRLVGEIKPHRVDRLKTLENAVVPQQAYPVFKAIIDADGQI